MTAIQFTIDASWWASAGVVAGLAVVAMLLLGRWVRRAAARTVEQAVAAYERAQTRPRHPSVRVNDIDDATIGLDEQQHRMIRAEIAPIDEFAPHFRAWSVAMWAGRNAKTIARRGARKGWSS